MNSTRSNIEAGSSRWGVLYAPRALWWSIFFLVWTLQVGLYAFASYYRRVGTGDALSVGEALLVAAVDWYLWALVCIFCFWIAKRLQLEKYSLRVLVPAVLFSAIAVTFARGLIDQVITPIFGWEPISLLDRLIPTLPGRFILVLLFIGVGYAIEYIRLHRAREMTSAHLRAELATTQLQMLKVQLQPHFLFNTLHAISSLMYIDVHAADRMLVRLSELLRRTLQTMDAQQVTLAEELSFLEPYVEIERTRLAERLNVEMRVAPGTRTALVPHLILQPLVENAIRHGITPKVEGGTLVVESKIRGDHLFLIVEDDGLGLGATSVNGGSGVGLTNTRERLKHLYADDADLRIENRESGGVRVSVRIPLELSGEAEVPLETAELQTQGV